MKESHKKTIEVWKNKVEKIGKAKRIKYSSVGFFLDTGEEMLFGPSYCPLCAEYSTIKELGIRECGECPVAKAGYDGCENSPYDKVAYLLDLVIGGKNPIRRLKKAIVEELEFLKGILGEDD